MEIEYTKELTNEIVNLINDEFERYANERGVKCNYTTFNFIAKEGDEVVGILTGYSHYDEVRVDDLVVCEKYRGRGIGTKLLKQVEDYQKNKGFSHISLFTHEFQAPKFYQKCGFQIRFIVENKENPKLTRYFLTKPIES